jgi:hypothetical protein
MDAMNAAEAAGEDTGVPSGTATPAEAPAAVPAEATPPTETGSETPADAGAADFLGDEKFDWSKLDPQIVPLAKQLQSDYTRKRQSEAERVRQAEEKLRNFEGLEPGAAQWARQIDQLARINPAEAAKELQKEANRLAGSIQAPTPQADPWDGVEPLSDAERLLLDERKVYRQQHAEMQRQLQELVAERARDAVEQQFAKLEKEVGRAIPYEERVQIAQWCQAKGQPDPEVAYKVLHWDDAKRIGREEAQANLAQKAGLGPAPGGVASREAPPGDRVPKTRREAIEMAFDEAARAA